MYMRVYMYVLEENAHLLDACVYMCTCTCTHVCVGQRVPISVNVHVCVCMYMYMYTSDRKCRLFAYMGRQSYVDACVVHVHVWDREYPFVDACVHVRTCTCV